MVRLTGIYTKVGDKGTTRLGDGSTVPKTHPRVQAYGAVDEANAAIGVVVAIVTAHGSGMEMAAVREELGLIQNDLFDVGADLSTPVKPEEQAGAVLRVVGEQTERLEKLIDDYNADLEPLDSFVLPGGTPPSAHLHVARTVVRRAERRVAALLRAEPETTNPETLVYVNRLSDLLFVLARVLNDGGRRDVLWMPGANRGDDRGA